MKKEISAIAVGDWFLTESLTYTRLVGVPWRVHKISGTKVYAHRLREAPTDGGEREIREERSYFLKSVRFVFTTEAEALLLSDFARKEGIAYGEKCAELWEDVKIRFQELAASTGTDKAN